MTDLIKDWLTMAVLLAVLFAAAIGFVTGVGWVAEQAFDEPWATIAEVAVFALIMAGVIVGGRAWDRRGN